MRSVFEFIWLLCVIKEGNLVMRILMLGNSFTFYSDMPKMLQEILGAEVRHHTRGGADLAAQLDPEDELGIATANALRNETWDYVVLQEKSDGPILARTDFFQNIKALCKQIRANGAVPVLYATWPFQKESLRLRELGISYEEMYDKLHKAYEQAAEENDALMADVGTQIYQLSEKQALYDVDGFHPNQTASEIAAKIIAQTIKQHEQI